MGFFDRFKDKDNQKAEIMKSLVLAFGVVIKKILPTTPLAGKPINPMEPIFLGIAIVSFGGKDRCKDNAYGPFFRSCSHLFVDIYDNGTEIKQNIEREEYVRYIFNLIKSRLAEYYKPLCIVNESLRKGETNQGELYVNILAPFICHLFGKELLEAELLEADITKDEMELFFEQMGEIFLNFLKKCIFTLDH
jgi:hypothetical protein